MPASGKRRTRRRASVGQQCSPDEAASAAKPGDRRTERQTRIPLRCIRATLLYSRHLWEADSIGRISMTWKALRYELGQWTLQAFAERTVRMLKIRRKKRHQ